VFSAPYERSIKAFLVFRLPIALLFFSSPRHWPSRLLGIRYRSATFVVRLLLFEYRIIDAMGYWPVYPLLTASHEQKHFFATSAISFVQSTLLNLAFRPFQWLPRALLRPYCDRNGARDYLDRQACVWVAHQR
jgi:hypothetical protein